MMLSVTGGVGHVKVAEAMVKVFCIYWALSLPGSPPLTAGLGQRNCGVALVVTKNVHEVSPKS